MRLDNLLSRTQVSREFGVCTATINRWVKAGILLEPIRVNSRRMFWEAEKIEEAKRKMFSRQA
jgi:DNA-binding transcriptional MerR regulator